MNFERPKKPEKFRETMRWMAFGLVSAALHGGVLALGSATEIVRAARQELNSGDEQELIELGQKLAETEQRIVSPFEFIAKAEMIEQGVSQDDVASATVDHRRVVNTGLDYKDTGEPVPVVLNYLLSEQGEYQAGQRSMIDAYNKKVANCDARLAKLTSEAAEIFPEYYALGWIKGQTFNGVDGNHDGKYDTPGVDTEPHIRMAMQIDDTHQYIVEGDSVQLEKIKFTPDQPTTLDSSQLLITAYLAQHQVYHNPTELKGLNINTGPKPIFRYPGSSAEYQGAPANPDAFQVTYLAEDYSPPLVLTKELFASGEYDPAAVTSIDARLMLQVHMDGTTRLPQTPDGKSLPVTRAELTAEDVEAFQLLRQQLRTNQQGERVWWATQTMTEYMYVSDPVVVKRIAEIFESGDNRWMLTLGSPAAAREVVQHFSIIDQHLPLTDISIAHALTQGKMDEFQTSSTLSPAVLKTLMQGDKLKKLYYSGAMTLEHAKIISSHLLEELSITDNDITPEMARMLATTTVDTLEIISVKEASIDSEILRTLFAAPAINEIELLYQNDKTYQNLLEQLGEAKVSKLTASENILKSRNAAELLNQSPIQTLYLPRFADNAMAEVLPQVAQLSIDTLSIGGIDDHQVQTADPFIALSKSKVRRIVFTHEYSAEQLAWIQQYLPNAIIEHY